MTSPSRLSALSGSTSDAVTLASANTSPENVVFVSFAPPPTLQDRFDDLVAIVDALADRLDLPQQRP